MKHSLNPIEIHNSVAELEAHENWVRAEARKQRLLKLLAVILRIIIVAMGVVLFFSGCKKKSQEEQDVRRCWSCSITKTHHTPTSGAVTTTGIDSICEKTAAELKVYNDTRVAEYSKGGTAAQISCQ